MPDAVLSLFADGRLLSADECVRLQAAWEQKRAAGEDLAAWLTRGGVFGPAAARTLDLIAKGFITQPDPAMLFTPTGLEKLKRAVAAPHPKPAPHPEATRDTTPRSPRATHSDIAAHNPTPRVPTVAASRSAFHVSGSGTFSMHRPQGQGLSVGVGTTIGKCLLTGVLGQGGHGVVYSALHQTLNIPVAVKVLLGDAEDINPDMVRQLRSEAQLMARLNHPNVIRVLDFDSEPVTHIILEYAEGPSLADLIAQTGGLWVPRAVDIFLQAARGLAAAWELNVVHRDIKPGNILLAKNGVAKIADLGLALTPFSGSKLVDTRQVVGTCAYMAPEQARTAHEVDFRADIYSLGATLYHCITGQLPFAAKSAREYLMKHAAEALVPPHVACPDRVDPDTSAVVVGMMAKEPEDRYASYDALIAALSALPCRTAQGTAKMTAQTNVSRPSLMG